MKCYNWPAPLPCFLHALSALIPSLPQASHSESPLYIKHFQYTGWPDHGVPLQPSSVVKFIQQVRKEVEVNGAPIVVHCRWGVGVESWNEYILFTMIHPNLVDYISMYKWHGIPLCFVWISTFSAGVGRSGTFITLDAMMERLKERDDLNIFEFVNEMRTRRMCMVQTMVSLTEY